MTFDGYTLVKKNYDQFCIKKTLNEEQRLAGRQMCYNASVTLVISENILSYRDQLMQTPNINRIAFYIAKIKNCMI